MEKYQIKPVQVPHLLRVVSDVFHDMRNEVKSPNDNPGLMRDENRQMHFMADLLKDLVETAYPLESEEENINKIIKSLNLKPISKAVFEDLDKQFEDIAKIMREYKPPKAGEF